MGVQTPVQPDYGSQSGTTYPTNIDKAFAVVKAIADQLAVYERSTPDMGVRIAGGRAGLTVLGETSITGIPVPTLNARIDVIYIDLETAARGRVQGTEAASPALPALASTQWPLASLSLTPGMSAITNSLIAEYRNVVPFNVLSWLLNRANTWNAAQTIANAREIRFDGTGADRGSKLVHQNDDNFVYYAKNNAGDYQSVWDVLTGVNGMIFNVTNGLNVKNGSLIARSSAISAATRIASHNSAADSMFLSNLNKDLDTADDVTKPSWALRMSPDLDSARIQRAGAGSPGSLATLVQWNNVGRQELGVVPLSRMSRIDTAGQNASQVVIGSGLTRVITLSLGAVQSNEKYLVAAWVRGTKGATAGLTRILLDGVDGAISLQKGVWLNSQTFVSQKRVHAANTEEDFLLFGIMRWESGLANASLSVASDGSSITINATAAQLQAISLTD